MWRFGLISCPHHNTMTLLFITSRWFMLCGCCKLFYRLLSIYPFWGCICPCHTCYWAGIGQQEWFIDYSRAYKRDSGFWLILISIYSSVVGASTFRGQCRKVEVHESAIVECFWLNEMQTIAAGDMRYFWWQWFVQISVFALLVWPYRKTWDVFHVFGVRHILLFIRMSICSAV